MNVEIVWDLINVLREYLKMALDEDDGEESKNDAQAVIAKRSKANVSNILSGVLCAF
jgi:hypothetical protein